MVGVANVDLMATVACEVARREQSSRVNGGQEERLFGGEKALLFIGGEVPFS